MKTIEKRSVWTVLKLAFFAVLFMAFSCNQDMADLEANQEGAQAKNSKAVLKTIAKGAKINGTNGIYFGPDDNLYIASFYGQNITVMNKQNGKILNQFGINEDGIYPTILGPDDLVFHPDGKSLYYTDIISGFVGRIDLDGNFMDYQYLAPGVNPITFLEDENDPENPRLFVALDFDGDGLYELDPEDLTRVRPIIVQSGPTDFPLGFFNAFDFGPDGRLYGPSFLFGKVISVDVGEWGDPPADPNDIIEDVIGGFTYPVAAKFGPDGLLTVLDQNGEVWKVDTEAKPATKTLFATLQPGLDNLAFDKDGTLYISNADFGWIVQILPSGQARTVSGGGMIGPQGVAVLQGANNKDAVFVGDLFRMRNFNGLTGKEEEVYKGYLVPEEDKLTMPFSVQADGENLIVTSWFSNLVQVWSPVGDIVLKEYSIDEEDNPIDAVRVNGEIVVSVQGEDGVIMAESGLKIASLNEASGLATDGTNLWAADWETGDIWWIDFSSGTPIISEDPVASGLSNPEGLAFEKPGSLVVVETGESRLSRIDIATGNVTIIAENLELSAPALAEPFTWWFDGVAVGPSGDIYVTGGGANVLYRISPK